MTDKNISTDIKSKSIKDTKEEINKILDKIEKDGANLESYTKDYDRLLKLNKHIDELFKKKLKEINSKIKKKCLKNKLVFNAKKIDLFVKRYINSQKKSLLTTPMNYGVLSGGKKLDPV